MFILSFRKKCTIKNISDLFLNVNRKISQKVDIVINQKIFTELFLSTNLCGVCYKGRVKK